MARLDAYIPIDRRFALTRNKPLPDRSEGAVLFADISSFSSTATALEQELGPRQGADELMMSVNQLFTGLVNQVHQYGGSVISFSGDAITCWFDQKLPEGHASLSDSAQRATACALAMQQVISRTGDLELATSSRLSLTIKVSVVAGTVRRFLVGSSRIQSLEVLAGELLDRAAAAEQIAAPGQVVIGAEILGRFGGQLQLSEWILAANGEYFALVSGLLKIVTPAPWPDLPQIDSGMARKWLLPPVYRRLQRGEEDFLAELRPSVAIFLQFSGINYDTDDDAGEKLDAFVCWLQKVLEQYGGYLFQVTVGDKGSYAVASTSAPLAHEDDSLRAVSAMSALKALPPELDFIEDLNSGISWGTMLIGAYGSELRRTFSEHGSETNLAARLMEEASPGQILVSSRVAEAARHEYRLRDLGLLKIKGRTDTVPVFAVEGRKLEQSGSTLNDPTLSPIIGRTAELTLFRSRLLALSEGHSGAIVVEGEEGIGKTRLISSFLQETQAVKMLTLLGSGDAVERAMPFHAWRPIFRDILKLRVNDTQTVVYERIMSVLPVENSNLACAELIDYTLDLCRVEDRPAASPTFGAGPDLTRELLLGILTNELRDDGQVLILDDAQWIDSASWALLNDARRSLVPLLTIIASRPIKDDALLPKEFESLLSAPDTARIHLSVLEPEESTALVAQLLGVSTLPESISQFICQRAGGHPFFSEEIAYAMIDAGILRIGDFENSLVTHNMDLDELNFPGTVQGVIASRIDRLDAATQLTLKVASVIGPTFSFESLYDIHPVVSDKENLHVHLGELARLDIAVADVSEGEANYKFKHILIQEIAYSRLLIAQRRQLHRSVAEWLEAAYALNMAPYFPLLAHHWGRAAAARSRNEPDQYVQRKALLYAEKSGEQSLKRGAYLEAIRFFNDALAIGSDPALEVTIKERATSLQQLGEAYHQWGQWSEARDKLAQAAALYGRPLPSGRVRVIGRILLEVLKQARNRLWPGRYIGRASKSEKQTILKTAHIYQSLSELSFLTNNATFSLYAVLYGLNLSEYGGLSPELVKAYSDVCVIVGLFGPQGMAKAYGEQAWNTALALDEPAARVVAKSGIGLYQINAGKLDLAQANLEQAWQMSEELDDRRLWGDSLGLLARTIRFRGELRRAGKLYAELAGPRSGIMLHRVWALNAQAIVALREGHLGEALGFLSQARDLPGERPEPQQEMITWAYLGITHLLQGDLGQARGAADQALALMEQIKASAYTHFEAFAAVAEVYMSLWEAQPEGDSSDKEALAAAARYLCRSLRRGTTKSGRPTAWLYQGWYEYLAGHPARARKHWQKGLAIAEEIGMPYELGRIHQEMGRHTTPDGLEKEEHLRRACDIFERMGAEYQLQRSCAALES